MKTKYFDIAVNDQDSVLHVLKRMDETKRKLLIVMEGDKFSGVVSIGDLQRAIIKGIDIHLPIKGILRHDVTFASTGDDIEVVKARMRIRRNELMPIVTPEGELADVIFWDDLFQEAMPRSNAQLGLPVIIMAGGEGTRLKPLTNVLPKALIPLRDKTMAEEIMDRFLECGCREFFISVNHKAEMIRHYFASLHKSQYNIQYIEEDMPLGTAGSLCMLRDKIKTSFFMTNCDILIDQDYSDILGYHRDNNNEITIVAALKNMTIPYGMITSREDGLLQELQEKPEFVFKINTGFYILEAKLLDEIPENTFFHITTLIEKLKNEHRRVGVYPINEKSWTDIGNWSEYSGHIRFYTGIGRP